MVGLGLGSANPATPPPGLPLGSAVWAPGGFWDLRPVAGANGAPIVAGQVSLSGSNVLVPASSPTIDDVAIGGQRGCDVVDTGVANTQPRWSCNALASLMPAGQPWSIYFDFRQTKQAQMPLVAALSTLSTDGISLQSIVERLVFRYTVSGVTTDITGTLPLAYDYHRLGATYDGANLRLYVDGALDPATPVAVPSLAISLNRWSWLAFTAAVTSAAATGAARRICFTPSYLSPAQIATVDQYFVAGDYTLPFAICPQLMPCGDSITATSVGTTQQAGIRAGILNSILANRQSIAAVGQFTQGIIQNRACCAQGGANIDSIKANMVAALGTAGIAPRLLIGMAGTNDVAGTPAAAAAKLLSLFQTTIPLAQAKNPLVQFAWSPITPIKPGAVGDTFWQPFNLLLTQPGGIFDQVRAAFPGVLIELDNPGYVGNAWSALFFGSDNSHPNQQGCEAIAAGQLGVLAPLFASISPT